MNPELNPKYRRLAPGEFFQMVYGVSGFDIDQPLCVVMEVTNHSFDGPVYTGFNYHRLCKVRRLLPTGMFQSQEWYDGGEDTIKVTGEQVEMWIKKWGANAGLEI